jgi:hypothetical protein
MRNRGELAEGWYDPQTLEKARSKPTNEEATRESGTRFAAARGDQNSEDDDYGPSPQRNDYKPGPARAIRQDLQVKRELASEEADEARRRDIESVRNERRADRRLQKERLDEIAPRAEGGTRERQLEKKREKADSNRAFAASAHDSADVEVKDSDLMGGGDGIDELKRMKQIEERKRSEREMRREENLAARRAETEERVQAMREKEEKTMSMLKELAKARFGSES